MTKTGRSDPDIALFFWFLRPRRVIRVVGHLLDFPLCPLDDQFAFASRRQLFQFTMSALRLAARRVPRATRLVPSFESPIQRRFAATSNAPQEVKRQVCNSVQHGDCKTNSTNSLLQKESTLPNPDPSPDSLTVSFINERAPFMVPTYVRPAPMMMKGQGCYLWDMENRRYLDFTSGIAVNSLGHCDPEIAKIIAEQVRSHRYMQAQQSNG